MSIESQIDSAIRYKGDVVPDIAWGSRHWPEDQASGILVDRAVSAYGESKLVTRPAGKILIENVNPGDHVICWSIDRMFRNVGDFGTMVDWFLKKNINLHFISENIDFSTAWGRLKASIMAVLAEHYSRMLSFRTREAHAIRKLRSGGVVKKSKRMDAKDANPTSTIPLRQTKSYITPQGRKTTGDEQTSIKRLWGYIRVSSTEQVDSGLSLEFQAKDVEATKMKMRDIGSDIEVLETISDEAVSCFKVPFFKRPGGLRILRESRPGDMIVVYRGDRIFRSLQDATLTLQELQRRGLVLYLVDERIRTDTEDGRWYLMLLTMFSELESRMKSNRVKEVLQRKKRDGQKYANDMMYYSAVPFGSQKRLIPSIEKATRLRLAVILWRHVGLTKEAACITANIIFHQRYNKPYAHIIHSTPKIRRETKIVKCQMLLPVERSWDDFIDSTGPIFAERVAEKIHECLTTNFDERSQRLFKNARIDLNDLLRKISVYLGQTTKPMKDLSVPAGGDF